MSDKASEQRVLPTEPPPSLMFEIVADVAILQAVVTGLAKTDPAVLATVRAALAQLAVTSARVGQHTPLVQLMDDTMQRRIAAFEAKLPGHSIG